MELTIVKQDRLSQCVEPMLDFQHSKYPYLVSNANQIELLSIAETYEIFFLIFLLFSPGSC